MDLRDPAVQAAEDYALGNAIRVLDHGYVRLVGALGDDLAVVNAARVSYDKESSWAPGAEPSLRLRERDKKLLDFLVAHDHTSPLRHAVLSFEIYAPLMVMRQWGKYRVGSAWTFEDSDDPLETWNESSRRYVTEQPTFYVPQDHEWRSAPENKKQGSGDPIPAPQGMTYTVWMNDHIINSISLYNDALRAGVCPEQARLYLPAYAMYIRARWTVSLQGVLHFLDQRLADDAQWEIREYAKAVQRLAEEKFPRTFEAWKRRDASVVTAMPKSWWRRNVVDRIRWLLEEVLEV